MLRRLSTTRAIRCPAALGEIEQLNPALRAAPSSRRPAADCARTFSIRPTNDPSFAEGGGGGATLGEGTATVRFEVLGFPALSVAFTVITARACWPGFRTRRNRVCSAAGKRSVSVLMPAASFAVAWVRPNAYGVPRIDTEPVAESEHGVSQLAVTAIPF